MPVSIVLSVSQRVTSFCTRGSDTHPKPLWAWRASTPWVESCCPRNSGAVRLLDKPTSSSETLDHSFPKGRGEILQDTDAARDWTEQEVRLIVADYFAMLEAELQGEPYKKSEHRKTLIPLLTGRSDGSVEIKHQNISSVLFEFGLPYVEGYKPRGNYQGR